MHSEPRRIVAADPSLPDPIHQALAALDGNGVVYLPPGNYRVATTVKLPSHVAVVGAGPELTTITLEPRSNCHVFTNDDHGKRSEGIELRGFRLEGNMRSQHKPPDLKGITFACGGYFKRVTDLVVADVVAHDIRQTAFHFNHCVHVTLDRLEADELGWSGVSTSGTDDIVLREVVVTRSGLDVRHSGIHLDGGRGAYVHALIEGCTGNGIMLDSKFSPLSDVIVRGVARRAMRGLSLSGDGENELTNVCASGDYSDNRECGVLVSNASNVFIVDATIASNGKAGIIVQGRSGALHCVVASSRITDSPDLVLERDDNAVAYVTETAMVPELVEVEPLASADARPSSAPRHRPLAQRVRGRLARSLAGTKAKPPARARPAASAAGSTPSDPPALAVPEDDAYEGTCNICGATQTFVRR
ncbi:MAG TPA: glycosyl hydrolase family 28-related protein, partial [Acidimicrobiia bacterium]|nr:glycosyl hydrolase family 28-related protein [Acidimicrobiia bacterium]